MGENKFTSWWHQHHLCEKRDIIEGIALITRNGMILEEYFPYNIDSRNFAAMGGMMTEGLFQIIKELKIILNNFITITVADREIVVYLLEDHTLIFIILQTLG